MSKETALATPSLTVNNSVSRAVVLPADTLDNNTCSPSLQKCIAEIACMFLGGITLASVTTTRVEESEDAL